MLKTPYFSFQTELRIIYNFIDRLTRTPMLTCRIRNPRSTWKDLARELGEFRMNFETELDA